MSFDFAEHLHVHGTVYAIHAFPLNDYLASLPARPRFRGWPGCSNGYRAAWEVQERAHDRVLCLTELKAPVEDLPGLLFGRADGPVAATWFSGMLRGTRGTQRRTGYPPRTFCDDEIHLEIVSGRVVREWVLDLRSVPDQTDDELRLSLPRFLWGPRLREGHDGPVIKEGHDRT
jgi:hypothetical protein